MLDVHLRYTGRGILAAASRFDAELLERSCQLGVVMLAKLRLRRSVKQNRYFHDLCERAFDNNATGPSAEQCPTWRHMKSWLLVEAGHCHIDVFEPEAMTKEVAAWIRKRDDTVVFTTNARHQIIARTAKSISFNEVGPITFNEIVNKVIDIILAEVAPGTSRKDWEPDAFKTHLKANPHRASSAETPSEDDQ